MANENTEKHEREKQGNPAPLPENAGHESPRVALLIQEKPSPSRPGLPMLLLLLGILAVSIIVFILGASHDLGFFIGLGIVLFVGSLIAMGGLKSLRAQEARVLTLFGDYYGTLKGPGYFYVNPFTSTYNPAAGTTFQSRDTKKGGTETETQTVDAKISLKLTTFDNNLQKINDVLGNPVEIRLAVIWRVVDTAKAVFNVDNYIDYLGVQSDSALRDVVRLYPYDVVPGVEIDTDGDGVSDEGSLRGSSHEVAERIRASLQERVEVAGLEIVDTRLTHLSYAPEIANAMLRRQQAGAIVDARREIVQGAVGIVDMTISELESRTTVNLSEKQKAQLASQLLLVLSGNREVQPTVKLSAMD